jgi:hypothetical protein
MVYAVGIIQGITELGEGKSIQILDVFEDTFVTPIKNSRKISVLFEQLSGKLDTLATAIEEAEAAREKLAKDISDSLGLTEGSSDTSALQADEEPDEEAGWDYSAAEPVAEEALFLVQDIRNTASSINRHMTADTTGTFFKETGALYADLSKLQELLLDEEKASLVKEKTAVAAEIVQGLKSKYRPAGILEAPLLMVKHFFYYTGFNRKYLRGYEAEMEKTSVFANTLRPPMQFARYMLLHDLGEKGVLGRDGWFFYKPGYEYLIRPYIRDPRSIMVDPNDKPLVDDPIKAILKFKKQLDDLGIELLVVIMPGKASIYPDMLNSRISPDEAGKITHSLRIIRELRELGVEALDLFAPFAEERKNDKATGDSMYLKTDTHWKGRGVRLAARVVADRIKQYPWYVPGTTEYVIDSVEVDRYGDVAVMTTLPEFKIRELGMNFPPEETKCYQVYSVKRDEEGNEVSRSAYKDDFRKPQILLLGDSFSRIYQSDAPRSAGWISHIAFELSQPIASIVSDGGASTLVRQKLARKSRVLKRKKLVIWEFVERDLRYGAEGWKDVELVF